MGRIRLGMDGPRPARARSISRGHIYGIVDPNEGATPLPAERAMGSSGGEGPTESPHRWLRGAAGGSANRVGGELIEDGVAYLRDPSGACAAIFKDNTVSGVFLELSKVVVDNPRAPQGPRVLPRAPLSPPDYVLITI